MSGQQNQPEPVQPAREPQTLASDAERDRTAGLLNAAFAEGRLTADEHAERVRAACTARTRQQMDLLTADLPADGGAAGQQALAPVTVGPGWCMLDARAGAPGGGWRAGGAPRRRAAVAGRPARRVVERYRRTVEPVLRGVAGVVAAVLMFAAGAAVGGRGGVAIASVWVTVSAAYCLANFWHCREAHCVVTGPGWALTAALGAASALIPGPALSWYQVRIEAAAFLVILAAGYGLEHLVAARTGQRTLPRGGLRAQNR